MRSAPVWLMLLLSSVFAASRWPARSERADHQRCQQFRSRGAAAILAVQHDLPEKPGSSGSLIRSTTCGAVPTRLPSRNPKAGAPKRFGNTTSAGSRPMSAQRSLSTSRLRSSSAGAEMGAFRTVGVPGDQRQREPHSPADDDRRTRLLHRELVERGTALYVVARGGLATVVGAATAVPAAGAIVLRRRAIRAPPTTPTRSCPAVCS